MLDRAHQLAAAVADALRALLLAIQEPGVLDRAGAGAIGVFVLACWLLSVSARRSR